MGWQRSGARRSPLGYRPLAESANDLTAFDGLIGREPGIAEPGMEDQLATPAHRRPALKGVAVWLGRRLHVDYA
jgi:hypothetical protein